MNQITREAAEAHIGLQSRWADWTAFAAGAREIDPTPGVYLMRRADGSGIVYVGMAGIRSGAGMRGRMAKYLGGQMTGLGYGALNQALADPDWLRRRLAEVEGGSARLATAWIQLAIERAQLEMTWTLGLQEAEAVVLEKSIRTQLRPYGNLWNIS